MVEEKCGCGSVTGTRRAARWLGVHTTEVRGVHPRGVHAPGVQVRRVHARRVDALGPGRNSRDTRAHAANRNNAECSRQMRQFTEANFRNVQKIRELSQHEAVPDWSAPFRQSFLNRVETEHAQETDDDDGSGGAVGGPCDRADARSDAIAAECHLVEGAGYY